MHAIIHHNIEIFKLVYRGLEDITPYFWDIHGYQTIISLIVLNDDTHIYKDIFLRILNDAKDISIEPPESPDTHCKGVCHWACHYLDLDVAKAMFNTKNVQINRFDKEFQTGAYQLAYKRDPKVPKMLELLIEYGFDVNARSSDKYPSLLEHFISYALYTNYPAIETLIKYGADINALHSKKTDSSGKKITLLQFVKEKCDSKLKKIFSEAEE